MKHLHLLYTLLFGVAVLLFFGGAYPHHLHYQEQYQLFLFDSTYVWDVVKLPGGMADLLGRFCTQFFLYAWVGALIIAILLSAVQLLTLRLVNSWASQAAERNSGWLYGLSFVPSFLLWLFLLDENALLGGVWAVLLTLLASWAFDRLPNGWTKRILLIAAVPLLYWMVGPVYVAFFLLQAMEADWEDRTKANYSWVRHPLPSLPDGISRTALGRHPVHLRHRAHCPCQPQESQRFEA